MLAVRAYGEAEFWLSGGKVVLIFMLFFFTFITMVGGNPGHDAYGFRNWRNPGPFAEFLSTGGMGKFEGFLGALWAASFCIVGPEYISIVAAEAKRPRIYVKTAFKTVYYRFGVFFLGGALCVGIVLPYNDPTLVGILSGDQGGDGTAAASPYVIAMRTMGVGVLPHITNALLITSIFSAGNTYTYAATRSLYSLARQGAAPHFLTKCTRNGVPIYAFALTMMFPFLSFLQVSSASSQVLTWIVNLITAGGLINYIAMCWTYLAFYRALKVQGINRATLPYRGWFQPYCAWLALVFEIIVVLVYGYETFLPGKFTLSGFFTYYTMVGVTPAMYLIWKLLKRSRIVPSRDLDLVWDRPVIDRYESTFLDPPVGFWNEILALVGIRRHLVVDRQA